MKIKKLLNKLLDPDSKLLAKNSSWVLLATAYQVGSAFLKAMIIARALGVEDYGRYAIVIAFVATVGEIFNFHFGPAMVKYRADYNETGRPDKILALYKAGYILSGVASVACFVTISTILLLFYGVFFDTDGLQMVIAVFSIGFSLGMINGIPAYILMVANKFKFNSILVIVNTTVEIAAICVAIYLLAADLEILIYSILVAQVIGFGIYQSTALLLVKDEVKGLVAQPVSVLKSDFKGIANFVISNSLSKTVQKMLKKGDILLLAAFTGSAQVGMYDVARKLSFSLLVIKDPLILAVYPQIAAMLASSRMKELKLFLRNIGLLSVIPYTAGAVFLYFFGDVLIQEFFGEEFKGAGVYLLVLVMAVGLDIVFFWSVPYILGLGKAGFRLRASIFSAVVTLGLGLVLVNLYGAMGVAVSILVGGMLLQGLFGVVIYGHLKKN